MYGRKAIRYNSLFDVYVWMWTFNIMSWYLAAILEDSTILGTEAFNVCPYQAPSR